MIHTFRSALALLLLIGLAVTTGLAQKPAPADVQLKAAITKEVVDGDLKAAIEMYRTIAKGADRVVAAKALLRIGQCYEKLGDTESRKAYESVVRDFADQKDVAEEARTRLAVMRAEPTSESNQLVLTRSGWGDVFAGVSADGRFVVRNSEDDSWSLRNWQTGESTTLPVGNKATVPMLSPDQRRVAYVQRDGQRWQVRTAALDGSVVRVLTEGQGYPTISVADWSPDGTRLLVSECIARAQCELGVMSAADGSVRRLGARVGIGGWTVGKWSPDGRYVLYVDRASGGLFVMSLDGASNVRVAEFQPSQAFQAQWAPDGRVLYKSSRAGQIDLLAAEIKNGKPVGTPILIKADIRGLAFIGVTPDGTLYWERYITREDVYVVELDAGGRLVSAPVSLHQHGGPLGTGPLAWSPDGRALAFVRPNHRIVIRSLQTGEEREVPGDDSRPVDLHWLADGSWLAAVCPQPGCGSYFGRYRVDAIDPVTGQHKTVVPALVGFPHLAVSPDGRSFFYSVSGGGKVLRLMRHDIGTTEDKELYRGTSDAPGFHSLSASPDGRQLAFSVFPEDPNGKWSLMTMALDGPVTRTLAARLSNDTAAVTAWTPDSKFVIAANDPGYGHPADILLFPSVGGAPRALGVNLPGIDFLVASRDGRHLAFTSGESVIETWMSKNVLPKSAIALGAKAK